MCACVCRRFPFRRLEGAKSVGKNVGLRPSVSRGTFHVVDLASVLQSEKAGLEPVGCSGERLEVGLVERVSE